MQKEVREENYIDAIKRVANNFKKECMSMDYTHQLKELEKQDKDIYAAMGKFIFEEIQTAVVNNDIDPFIEKIINDSEIDALITKHLDLSEKKCEILEKMNEKSKPSNTSSSSYKAISSSSVKRCNACGNEMSETAKFCSSCGENMHNISVPEELLCTNCGMANEPNSIFCVYCGNKI